MKLKDKRIGFVLTGSFCTFKVIKEQIKIAAGEKLEYKQNKINISGHSIECRINAENPEKNFRPSPR